MSEIEKATFAVWLTQRLLLDDKKILACAAINELYKCGISKAKTFVETAGCTKAETDEGVIEVKVNQY